MPMPRKDRSFTISDVVRFTCKNLSPRDRRLALRVFAVGDPCGDDPIQINCDDMLQILSALSTACDIIDGYLGSLLKRIPLFRRLTYPLDLMCNALEGYAELYELMCSIHED
jgi:hypothetical protein